MPAINQEPATAAAAAAAGHAQYSRCSQPARWSVVTPVVYACQLLGYCC